MIQRIQSIYLVLGALALLALFLFNTLWSGPVSDVLPWFPIAFLLLVAATALLAITTVFRYRDRRGQRKLIIIVQWLTVLVIVGMGAALYVANDLGVRTTAGIDWGHLVMLLLPGAAYVFFYLARRGVERDIALVRSMDRLR